MAQQRIQIFNGKPKGKGKKPSTNGLSFLFNGAPRMSNQKGKGKKPAGNPHHGTAIIQHPGNQKGKKKPTGNPMRSGREGGGAAIIELGGGALLGALVPGLILENFVPSLNSGFIGYISEGVLGVCVSYFAGRFFGKRVFYGGIAGTGVGLAYRAVQDMRITPSKAVAANVRDAQAAAAAAPARVGTVVNWPFRQPQVYAALPEQGAGPGAMVAQMSQSGSGMGRSYAPGQRVMRRR